MLPLDRIPVVKPATLLKATLQEMTKHRLGIACIIDTDGKLAGIFTDGDVRRMLLRDQKPFAALFVDDIIIHASRAPTTVQDEDPLASAIATMETKQIWDLPVLTSGGRLTGLLHLHPAIKAVMGL
jgi:arabinose-5-phosphate isomerase